MSDAVNHPKHYTSHPSGIEAIQVTEHFNFCKGNAIKYIWRSGEKGSEIEDLRKAAWYINREIERIQNAQVKPSEVEVHGGVSEATGERRKAGRPKSSKTTRYRKRSGG